MRTGAIVLAVFFTAGASLADPVSWPEGKKAAVVLTYDDALSSQLDIAIPALDAAGLKGTFFLAGSGVKPEAVTRWRAAAAEGHELGNHTLFHPCARATYPMPERYAAESYTVDTMLAEIGTMNTMLTAIDGKMRHSLATPCGNKLAGGVDYIEPLRRSAISPYVRGVGWPSGTVDPMDVPSRWFDSNATGADMIAAVKQAEQSGGLLVFGFHGVGGDHLQVSAKAHAELVEYLKANQATVWTTTFTAAMDYATSGK